MASERSGRRPPLRRRDDDGAELTQWPRGLVGYTPAAGAPDLRPDPSEDRTANRIDLAARLLAVRRNAGGAVDDLLGELHAVERAHRAGRRDEARHRLERLLGALGEAVPATDRPTAPRD